MNKLVKFIIITLIALASVLLYTTIVYAQDWDRSTLAVTGHCVVGGIMEVTVTNNGSDMQGPVDYEFLYAGPIVPQTGTLQLKAGESITLQSIAAPGTRIEFVVYQRPGHPGLGEAKYISKCGPNAVELVSLSAGPVTPDRNGWLGDTPLREDIRVFVAALACGIFLILFGRLVFSR